VTGARLVVVSRSRNPKTGDVPTVWVGRSLSESRETCEGCLLLASGDCYAQYGAAAFAINSIRRAAARAKSWRKYTIQRALRDRAPSARFVRFSALGDIARASPSQVLEALNATRQAGLAVVGYTHFWREKTAAYLRGSLMASVSGENAARRANAAGWRAAIFLPAGTTGTIRDPDGSIFAIECPAIAAKRHGKSYTCNDCAASRRGALCDASIDAANVYFADHGPSTRARRTLPVFQP